MGGPELKDEHRSIGLSLLRGAHQRAVFGRRVRVLTDLLVDRIPAGASVLDIGSGDGTIASLIAQKNPSVSIRGIEFAPRPTCLIECDPFDGTTIPHPSASFDVCMFVDVLHHAPDEQGIARLLSEACRVSRRFVLIKDHLSESRFDFRTLQFMDWVGNRPHGVVLPYNYQSRAQWDRYFFQAGLKVQSWNDRIPTYPFPFSALFGRHLHFVALLEKDQGKVTRQTRSLDP
jgi:SAM-dependent methyltransferase